MLAGLVQCRTWEGWEALRFWEGNLSVQPPGRRPGEQGKTDYVRLRIMKVFWFCQRGGHEPPSKR